MENMRSGVILVTWSIEGFELVFEIGKLKK